MNNIYVGGNIIEKNRSSKISDIPQNKTLYVDQFTGKVPDFESERAVFTPHTLEDVFEHYKPSVTGVELTSPDQTAYEDFSFDSLEDFDDEKIIEKSNCLQSCKNKIDVYNSAIINLQRNRDLKCIMENGNSKANLIEILRELQTELKETM